MADTNNDSRFVNILKDPRYRPLPKRLRKVKIDKRFQSMFTDKKFKVKYTVDKRGRPINETSTENLRKYYNLESDNSPASDEDDDIEAKTPTSENSAEPGRFVKRQHSDDEVDNKELISIIEKNKIVGDKLDHKTRERLQNLDIDYARGEGALFSGSSSSDDSSEAEEESDVEHLWGELDADAERTEESTKRIAICNMDWDNIKAMDIMVLLNSFIPAGGIIHKVTVYPSEYGLKRMQEEEVRGPIELTEDKLEEQSDNDGNEEGSVYHMEKLRRYQLNRLKYYYAVVECDTLETADKLYSECDGMEYESSATKLDLRFIPDDVTFDQEPREVCAKLPDMAKYKPRLFTTTALQQAKVELTWDATNPNRAETIKGALGGKIDDLDLKEYLASNSSEDEENEEQNSHSENDDEDPIQKYKNLLEEIEQKEDQKKNKDMEMEITWGWGIKDKAEELVKKKMNEGNDNLTPFEKLLKKRKEKKKQKKLKNQDQVDEKDDISNSSDDVPSDVDMNDPYFAEEFNKNEFKSKKSKSKAKGGNEISNNDLDENVDKNKAELELLLDDEDGKAHFSLKKIQESESNKKSKRKKKLKEKMMEQKQQLPDFEVNVDDKRFSALYDSHLFHIDPNNPNFKKTKNMERLIQEKLKRRPADIPSDNETKPKKSKEDAELSLLVKNIKRKTKNNTLTK